MRVPCDIRYFGKNNFLILLQLKPVQTDLLELPNVCVVFLLMVEMFLEPTTELLA